LDVISDTDGSSSDLLHAIERIKKLKTTIDIIL